MRLFIWLSIFIAAVLPAVAQDRNYISSKEGKIILNRFNFINNCLRRLQKDRTDKAALEVCECQAGKIDGHFTNKQYRQLGNSDMVDLSGLISADSALQSALEQCYANTGRAFLINAEAYQQEFVNSCIQSIWRNSSTGKLDSNRVKNFCTCQLNLVTSKQMADAEIAKMNNPNSVIFFEMMYKCGDPFREDDSNRNWNPNNGKDVLGPDTDTVRVLTIDGMTYIKLKTGSLIQFWLFDTGASDLLISKDMEEQLTKEGMMSQNDYIGIGKYEMANGAIDTCRKYRLNNIQVGHYRINNIVVAVSDKSKRIIAGKSLLNKFSNWTLDNKTDLLLLRR